MTQIAKRANISAVYIARVRHRGDGTLAVGAVDTLGKRTQVEADDGPFQPDTRRRDDFIDGNGQSSAAALSLFSSSSSILITRFVHSRANRCRIQFQPR